MALEGAIKFSEGNYTQLVNAQFFLSTAMLPYLPFADSLQVVHRFEERGAGDFAFFALEKAKFAYFPIL